MPQFVFLLFYNSHVISLLISLVDSNDLGIKNKLIQDSNDMEIMLEMGIKNLIQDFNLPQYSNELENGFQENGMKKHDVYFVVSETVRRTSLTRYINSKEIKHAEAAEEIENLAEAGEEEEKGIQNLAQHGIEHKQEMEIEVRRNDCKAVVLWKPPLMSMSKFFVFQS